jgi:hypothetical protein
MTQGVADIAGSWMLKSCYLRRVDAGERLHHFGENPRGALIMHEGGRMAAVITPRGQPALAGEAEMAAAYGRMIVYSGRYCLQGNRFVTDVDVSWLRAGWGPRRDGLSPLTATSWRSSATPLLRPAATAPKSAPSWSGAAMPSPRSRRRAGRRAFRTKGPSRTAVSLGSARGLRQASISQATCPPGQ